MSRRPFATGPSAAAPIERLEARCLLSAAPAPAELASAVTYTPPPAPASPLPEGVEPLVALGSIAVGDAPGPFNVNVDWGDGSPEQLFVHASNAGMEARHRFLDSGEYTVRLRVTDAAGATTDGSFVLPVTNVAPEAVAVADAPVLAGEDARVRVAQVFEQSPTDLAAGIRYSYDFDRDGAYEVVDSPAGEAVVPGRFLTTPGLNTVHVRVADKDGGASVAPAIVYVAAQPVDPLVLRPLADAYVRDGAFADTNYGLDPQLQVGRTAAAGGTRLSYFRFDLNALSLAGRVQSVKLRVFGRLSAASTAGVRVGVRQAPEGADTPFAETAMTWNFKPTPITDIAFQTVTGTAGRWYEFDVTALARELKAGFAPLLSLVLRAPDAGNGVYATFDSDESAGGTAPQLLVRQLAAGPTPQQLLVTNPAVKVQEGEYAVPGSIRLAARPSGPVTVTITRTSGDPDLRPSPATLTFTPDDWSNGKSFSVHAAPDADRTNGTATFALTAPGVPTKTFTIAEADRGVPALTTARAAADAYVRDGTYANTNYGQATELAVKRSLTAGNTRAAYLRFDISKFDGGQPTTLRLWGRLSDTTNPSVAVNVAANYEALAWAESGITYANEPGSQVPVGAWTVAGTTLKRYELDVTQIVAQARMLNRTSITFVLTAPLVTHTQALFNSDEAAANRPELSAPGLYV